VVVVVAVDVVPVVVVVVAEVVVVVVEVVVNEALDGDAEGDEVGFFVVGGLVSPSVELGLAVGPRELNFEGDLLGFLEGDWLGLADGDLVPVVGLDDVDG
jgi:hypothetical protein